MRRTIIILFLFLNSFICIAQETIEKTVIDKETGKPILFAHVFKQSDLLTGTITNANGKFVLKSIKKGDTIKISHLAYFQYENTLKNIISDTIYLLPKTIKLNEVIVHGLSPHSIMKNVINNLEKNHLIEPVMYQIYGRFSIHNKDKSQLHILSEQVTNVYYKKLGKHPFAQIIKLRIKPFSKIGKKYFKTMRMITTSSLFSNASFIFSDNPIFNKRKLKRYYNIKIIDTLFDNTYNLIKLKCSPKKEKYSTIILYVDRNSYAITKIYEYRPSKENIKNDVEIINFKKVGSKWYFNTITRKYLRFSDKRWKPDASASFEMITLFNINKNTKFEDTTFKPEHKIIAKEIKHFVGKWTDDFWNNYNYIPLPSWIEEKTLN